MPDMRTSIPTVSPGEILPRAAQRSPQAIGLVTETAMLTYADLDRLTRDFAAALQHRGISHGDVVSLFGQNSWEWVVAYHGALRAGAVVNPVNVMLTAPELAYVLADCNSRALIVGSEQRIIAQSALEATPNTPLVAEYGSATPQFPSFGALLHLGTHHPLTPPDIHPDDLCAIIYTSGTTGHPKGAMHSHRAVLLNCALTATMHVRSSTDIVVTALPTAHVYGNVAVNSTFLVGGRVVLMERFDSGKALGLMATENATMFEGVPTMYAMLLADTAIGHSQLGALRLCTVGGQVLSREVAELWQQRSGAQLIELWGMTELAGLGTTHSPWCPSAPGSIGMSLPGIDVRIAAVDGAPRALADGEHGELQVRGPIAMLGYHNNPQATRDALTPDGWLRTGDVGYRDPSGHLYILDRIKDVIITAGYNVYPAEIERVISAHPEVALVGVGRRADQIRGETAVAYIVKQHGSTLTAETILDYCRDKLAAYKRPRSVVFVDRLPTTSSGKVMRRRLGEAPSGEMAKQQEFRTHAPATE